MRRRGRGRAQFPTGRCHHGVRVSPDRLLGDAAAGRASATSHTSQDPAPGSLPASCGLAAGERLVKVLRGTREERAPGTWAAVAQKPEKTRRSTALGPSGTLVVTARCMARGAAV